MRQLRNRTAVGFTAVLVGVLATLALASGASAKLTGEFTKFQQCPWTDAEAFRCAYSLTSGGEAVLGSKKVPIVNPVVLQGGYSAPNEAEGGFAKFIAATNGETLSKSPQPVPGGLLGLVPPEGSPPLVKAALKFFLENGLTGVNTTLELAKPASDIRISELNLALGEGVTLKLPLKARLENPFLGSNCYVGSSSDPIIWELTSGVTSPPGPNKPISGKTGTVEFFEEGEIVKLDESVLVDNSWSAPEAQGCAGILSSLARPHYQLASRTAFGERPQHRDSNQRDI